MISRHRTPSIFGVIPGFCRIKSDVKVDCFRCVCLTGNARCIGSNCPRMNRRSTMWSLPSPGSRDVLKSLAHVEHMILCFAVACTFFFFSGLKL